MINNKFTRLKPCIMASHLVAGKQFKIIKHIIIFLIFNFSLLIFNLKPVRAQQVSLSLSPPLVELIIKPGKSVLVAYQIENLGDPVYLNADVVSFEVKDNLGNVKLKEKAEGPFRFSLDNSALKLNQPFFLKTRQKEQLLLRIRAIEGAPEGDYYYTLIVSTQPRMVTEGDSIGSTKATIGTNIITTVTESGKIDIKGKIALFDVLPRFRLPLGKSYLNFFDSNDKIPIVLILENKGKNFIKPEGEIILKGNFGETAHYQLLPQNILAESQRLIEATPSAEVELKKPVSLILSGFFLGRYRLSTNINFGQGIPNVFAATSFIALPFKFILGLFGASIMIFILIKRDRNN